jgi:hypothetical protein
VVRVDEILELQADLHAWLGDETFRSVIEKIMQQRTRLSDRGLRNLSQAVRRHARDGYAYHVAPGMSPLVETAAATLPGTTTFRLNMCPTLAGVVRFVEPLPITDVRGNVMLVHLMTWGPAGVRRSGDSGEQPGVLISLWNDLNALPDHYGREILTQYGKRVRQVLGRWSFIGCEILYEGLRVGPWLITPGRDSLPAHLAGELRPFTNVLRYFAALLELLDQTIVMTRTERANVHTRRVLRERKLRDVAARDVTVITLRRAYDELGTHHSGGREYSCRWLVRGFWRDQRVGPGRAEVRRTWVTGHVKGPADQPFRVLKKIYKLSR